MAECVYFDCFSGCSGDMLLGALIDAGLPLDELKKGLSSLDLREYEIIANKVIRSGITATKFDVITNVHHAPQDHDHSDHQNARSLKDILKIIEDSRLSAFVKQKSSEIFRLIGEVEAQIHDIDIESVHFHEIGAVDSIVDIVGSVLAFEIMGIKEFYASPLQVGGGTVKMDHGVFPVPAPATLSILARKNAPVINASAAGAPQIELLTPTGAAIITSMAVFECPELSVKKTGYGAGGKEFKEWPNVLRVWIGQTSDLKTQSGLVMLETNIDDMNSQMYGYLREKLFEKGALDVWYTPIQMKKNRPAIMLSVLARKKDETNLSDIIMRETTTMGIRSRDISRHISQREIVELETSLGKIRIKVKKSGKSVIMISPEYEDCKRAAAEHGIPLQEVFRIVTAEASKLLPEHE